MNAPATSRRPTSRPAARIAALLIPLGIAATPLPSFADLPTLEDPSRGTGSGIMTGTVPAGITGISAPAPATAPSSS